MNEYKYSKKKKEKNLFEKIDRSIDTVNLRKGIILRGIKRSKKLVLNIEYPNKENYSSLCRLKLENCRKSFRGLFASKKLSSLEFELRLFPLSS